MVAISTLVICLAVVAFMIWSKKFFAGARCSINVNLQGKTAVITGGNTGIGYQTVKKLSQLGCKVIFGARDEKKNQLAIKNISKTAKIVPTALKLDLSDQESIQKFAQDVKSKLNGQCIDFLINNAAVIALPQRKLTKQGLQMQIGVNHFGHFYLTYLLWPQLKKCASPRIINVSSKAVQFHDSEVDFNNINFENGGYNPFTSYARSKTANVMFTKHLQTKFDRAKINAIALSLHPGTVRTEAVRQIVNTPIRNLLYSLLTPLIMFLMKSPEEGAQTTLYTLLERQEKLVKGSYYNECRTYPIKYDKTRDTEKEQRLWKISENVFHIKFDI